LLFTASQQCVPPTECFFIYSLYGDITGDTGDGVYSCGSCRHQQLKTTGDTPFFTGVGGDIQKKDADKRVRAVCFKS